MRLYIRPHQLPPFTAILNALFSVLLSQVSETFHAQFRSSLYTDRVKRVFSQRLWLMTVKSPPHSITARKKAFGSHGLIWQVWELKWALLCCLGDKTPQFIRVLCVVTNVCLFVFFFGRGVRTWPETPPLLGHHHEVHHFYKSAEPVLVDHTWLQLVNTSPPHLHRIVLIREQKNIFRKLAVNYQQIQRSLTRLSTHQVQGRNNWPLQKIPQHTIMLFVCHPCDKQRTLWHVMVFSGVANTTWCGLLAWTCKPWTPFQGFFLVVISPDSKWEQIASSLIWWVTCR